MRNVHPRRFAAAVAKPCAQASVVLVMRAVYEREAGALTLSRREFVDGVAALETYGRERRETMVSTLFPKKDPSEFGATL